MVYVLSILVFILFVKCYRLKRRLDWAHYRINELMLDVQDMQYNKQDK
ncbi:hypothetical protein MCCARTNEY_147 [Bacillus phage vB_BanH_McCartney]|nr:hypothetical protein MCCARTNEY_147 [Bacillus phage vB_BanH_McCartney]